VFRLSPLATIAALLVLAAPASAGTAVGNPGDAPARGAGNAQVTCAFPDVCRAAVLYNGHAGLGANL
jgi:hypothetical protein